jgi:hypothetical protein
MAKFDTVKKTIIVTAKAIKQFASMIFDHLKNVIDIVITKIDTKKTLTDVNKSIIVSLLSYSVVFASGYHVLKKYEFVSFFGSTYHSLSDALVYSDEKSKLSEMQNVKAELDKAYEIKKDSAPSDASLIFTNNEGVNFYKPEGSICEMVTGSASSWNEGVAIAFNVPMSSVRFIRTNIVESDHKCLSAKVDTAKGVQQCLIGSIAINKNGDFLVTAAGEKIDMSGMCVR